ncbi:MAG: hypothetical protein CK522_01150 [Opitutia bacterium]|nr:MAG: hypothetical protein CK522_01150 [Opitutae bacterium]
MLFVFAALSLAAATPDLPPAPPRVTMMTIPGRDVFALAYDVKRVDLPLTKQRELSAALEAAQLDDLLAAHLRLRTALSAAKKADSDQAETAQAAAREKERYQKQAGEVDRAEKLVETAQQRVETAQRRREDAKTIDGYRSTLTANNNRLSNERRQLARAKELLQLAEGRAKEATQAESLVRGSYQAAAADYAKAATTAEPGLRKLRAAAGLPEPK